MAMMVDSASLLFLEVKMIFLFLLCLEVHLTDCRLRFHQCQKEEMTLLGFLQSPTVHSQKYPQILLHLLQTTMHLFCSLVLIFLLLGKADFQAPIVVPHLLQARLRQHQLNLLHLALQTFPILMSSPQDLRQSLCIFYF